MQSWAIHKKSIDKNISRRKMLDLREFELQCVRFSLIRLYLQGMHRVRTVRFVDMHTRCFTVDIMLTLSQPLRK